MLEVSVSGTPFARGQAHGTAAAKLVAGSLEFYNKFFSETAKLPWDQVTAEAEKWLPLLEKEYPQYVEEIRGE